MKDNMNVILFLVGIVLVIFGLCVQIAPIGFIGLILGVIGLIWMAVESSEKSKEQQKKLDNDLLNKAEANNIEKKEYLEWLNSNYKISKILGVGEGMSWHIDKVFAVDEDKRVVLFGKKEIKFESIINVELTTESSQHTTTTTEKNNPVGRAVVGGIVAGGVGAIVGASSAKETSTSNTYSSNHINGLFLYLNQVSEPVYEYKFVYGGDCRDIYATLLAIVNLNKGS